MKIYNNIQDVLNENWRKNPRPLRDKGGVYRIVNRANGELLYIGQSANVGHRLTPSCHLVFRRDLHDVYVLFVEDTKERYYMEGRFVTLLKPRLNQRAGLRPRLSEDIKKVYYDQIFK
jgi:hypothetical protein